jgi:hypothetical protein
VVRKSTVPFRTRKSEVQTQQNTTLQRHTARGCDCYLHHSTRPKFHCGRRGSLRSAERSAATLMAAQSRKKWETRDHTGNTRHPKPERGYRRTQTYCVEPLYGGAYVRPSLPCCSGARHPSHVQRTLVKQFPMVAFVRSFDPVARKRVKIGDCT